MLDLYKIKNPLIFFATYVHIHLFAPLTSCTPQIESNICAKIEQKNFLPQFIFRLLTQVLKVAILWGPIKKFELVPTFSDFSANSSESWIQLTPLMNIASCINERTDMKTLIENLYSHE